MIEVRGLDSFDKFSKTLNEASHDLAGEFSKAAVSALKPLPKELDQAIEATMPRRGGYASRVRRSAKMIIRLQSGGRFSLRGRHAFRQLDRGILRHPLFGDRERWYQQHITPGFWSKTVGHASIGVEREMRDALQRMVDRINRAT